MLKIVTFAIFLLILFYYQTYSQCTPCSAAFSSSAFTAGTSNVGVLKEGSLRIIGMNHFIHGSRFYSGSEELKKYYDEELNIHFMGLNIGYGLTKKFTLETEIGAFPDKDLNFGFIREKISGFSSAALIGKYTIYSDRANAQEITLGLGGRLPLTSNTTLSGSPGLILQLFYFKNLTDDLNMILFHRSELFAEGRDSINLGNSFVTSLFLTKGIIDDLTGIIEARYDYLTKSNHDSTPIINTGRSILAIVPQLSYHFTDISISGFVELPIIKNYEGVQLSEKIGAGIALIYML
ncbi:MAG: hypothetical protein RO257_00085 [Candidatus Kapabacteria bacterium]|nr:hypothetical protein [Candidatus Kapabacteria bacterium]